MVETKIGHTTASNSLGDYNGGALTVGGKDQTSGGHTNECEVLIVNSSGHNEWIVKKRYPFHSR